MCHVIFHDQYIFNSLQIKYSFSCLQCPSIYAQVDERTGEAVAISEPIPLPALNVRTPKIKKEF